MNYKTLKNKIYQNKLSKLLDDNKAFFAFSESQLLEGIEKTKSKREDLVSCGIGMIMPKQNIKSFNDGMVELQKWLKSKIKEINPNEIILYELNNYEAYYTGDITDALEVLETYGFTRDEVYNVFKNKNYQLNK
jgi:hypothetical protein